MIQKACKKCGFPDRLTNRRFCKECYILYNREKAKRFYHENGGKIKRAKRTNKCSICNNDFPHWGRKDNQYCPECRKDSYKTGFQNSLYIRESKTSKNTHREIARNLLGRNLDYNEVIHHVDENPLNNSLDNLWIMSRHQHGKLHLFLRLKRVAYEKSSGKYSVNCWNSFRVVQTTAWLEMTGANVIKLNELANQQPSSLNGEGSETKHGESKGEIL